MKSVCNKRDAGPGTGKNEEHDVSKDTAHTGAGVQNLTFVSKWQFDLVFLTREI